jgi:hypothetical protein
MSLPPSLSLYHFEPGDLALVDRGYNHPAVTFELQAQKVMVAV